MSNGLTGRGLLRPPRAVIIPIAERLVAGPVRAARPVRAWREMRRTGVREKEKRDEASFSIGIRPPSGIPGRSLHTLAVPTEENPGSMVAAAVSCTRAMPRRKRALLAHDVVG